MDVFELGPSLVNSVLGHGKHMICSSSTSGGVATLKTQHIVQFLNLCRPASSVLVYSFFDIALQKHSKSSS